LKHDIVTKLKPRTYTTTILFATSNHSQWQLWVIFSMTLKDIMGVVAAYVPRSISSLVCHKDQDWSLSFFTWLIWRSLLASGHVWSLHQYA